MKREIAIADAEPARAIGLADRMQGTANHERLVAAAPTAFTVPEPGERIRNRIEIGTDAEPHPFEIVTDVRDDRETVRLERPRQSGGETGTAETAGEQDDLHDERINKKGGRMTRPPSARAGANQNQNWYVTFKPTSSY